MSLKIKKNILLHLIKRNIESFKLKQNSNKKERLNKYILGSLVMACIKKRVCNQDRISLD